MASGLLGFLGFGKKSKPNLVPDILPQTPQQVNPKMYGSLSDLAQRYMQGPGFGEDYVSKTTNPIASSMRRNFQNVTSPFISNEYSKRGISRSNLAADAQGKAQGDVESNIGDLMAQFYQLNEAQKKTDTSFGANLGQTILGNDVNAQHNLADESARIRDLTAGRADTNNANSLKRQNQTIGALMNMVVPGSGMAFSSSQPVTQDFTKNKASGGSSGVKTQILGSLDPSQLDAMNIEELLALFGG